ncbi:MAG: SpoIIE family protein phosphatase [Spirochaetia bacterium]|nr:SpoIIE family protein phosphatase [Spirochaetia bacterium]
MRFPFSISSLFCSLLILSGFMSPVRAGFVVNIYDAMGKYRLGHYLEILEDPSRQMTFEQISSPKARNLFVESQSEIPNFGFSDSVFWVRFRLLNSAKYSKEYYLEFSQPLTDHITIYYLDENGSYKTKKAGDNLPFLKRDIDFHNFIFQLPVHSGMNTYYLRIDTTSSVTIDMKLFSHAALLDMMNSVKTWLGFYYGIMMVMLLYNLFIYLTFRDINYLYYATYILSFIIFQFTLNGLSFQYLWPNSIWWANQSPAILMGIISLTGLIFTRYFLRTWENARLWDNVLVALSIPVGLSIIVSVFSYKYGIRFGTIIGPVLLATMLITGFVCLLRGDRAARYYLLAWSFFLVGSILKALQSNGIVASTFITIWGQQIGSAIDVTLLSLAMMDRFNLIKVENEKNQFELIEIEKLQSESLEKTVQTRTNELLIERNKLQSRNKIMEYEISLARSIQQKMIPVEIKQGNIAAMYHPMIMVGGDFYDIISFKDSSKTGIFMSDVAGHGVQAAFITSMIKTVLLQSRDKLGNPAELLAHINDFLTGLNIQGFITIYYGIYDPADRSLIFSNGGHPSPYIISDDVRELKGYRTIPVGIMDNEGMNRMGRIFQNDTRQLPPGSKLLLYTDGITECTPVSDWHKSFDQHGLKEVFLNHKDEPCHIFLNSLFNSLVNFRGDNAFSDDICAVCLDIL